MRNYKKLTCQQYRHTFEIEDGCNYKHCIICGCCQSINNCKKYSMKKAKLTIPCPNCKKIFDFKFEITQEILDMINKNH